MRTIYKITLIIFALILLFSKNVAYSSMADYTDEQADQKLKQEQERILKEQEERLNKSSNNYLKNLLVKDYEITPSFDKQYINYEITQEITENYIEIEAETDDENASVSGTGKIELSSGENNLRIDVTAENGTTRSYFIKTMRVDDEKLKSDSKLIDSENKEEWLGQEYKDNYKRIAVIALIAIFVIVIIVIIVKKQKK